MRQRFRLQAIGGQPASATIARFFGPLGIGWSDGEANRWGDLGTQPADRDAGFATFTKGQNGLLPSPQQGRNLTRNLVQNPGY